MYMRKVVAETRDRRGTGRGAGWVRMIMDMISSVGMPVDSRRRRLRRNERVHSIFLGITGGRGRPDTGCESLDARQKGVRMIFRRRAGTLPVLNLEQFVK